uniref:Ribosomal protein S4 n=1 Tax=Babesia gibsoni TaxID=33632 RepID=A0A6M8NYC1_BABGI|nr:ribosomal protein S4 [Babesia gibsoni]
MNLILNKIKILKKLNLYTFYGFTNKFNLYYTLNKTQIIYKLVKNIKLLKILYNLKHKKLKIYLSLNIYKLIKLLKILKSRIDNILFKSNLFLTLNNLRQYIIHKHILLNNKIIQNFSYIINNNDIIYILNLNIKILINNIIYNYFIKTLKINLLNNKIFKLFKYRKYLKYIILYNNYTFINNSICYKTFKLKININNNINNIINSSILHI